MTKSLKLTLLFFLFSTLLTAQTSDSITNDPVKKLVSEGIKLHDAKKYDDAMIKYKEALKLNPNSSLVLYEMGYTFFALKDYKKAMKYANEALKQNSDNQEESYVLLGNSLNMLGKPDESIKKYGEGIRKFPESYLLPYNQALVYFQNKKFKDAEQAVINAVKIKPTHGSSHFLLSAIMKEQGKRVQSILCMYYFLCLEPNSTRSQIMYKELTQQLKSGVEKKDEKNININLFLSPDDEFGAVETIIGISAANDLSDENKDKSELDLFVKNNKLILSTLGLNREEKSGFWWEFYVDKFISLSETQSTEAFCYYISQPAHIKEVKKWFEDHRTEAEIFYKWLKNNF